MNGHQYSNGDKRPAKLDVLLKEYELAEQRLSQTEERLIQLIGVGLPVLSATVGFLLTQNLQNSAALAWLSPSFFIVFYALIIYALYNKVAYVHYCRLLADMINAQDKDGDEVLLRFKPKSPQSYSSIRFKDGFHLEQFMFCLLYVIFLGVGTSVLIVTVMQASDIVDASKLVEPWRGNTLRWVYSLAGLLEIISLFGATYVLPAKFDKLSKGRKQTAQSGQPIAPQNPAG